MKGGFLLGSSTVYVLGAGASVLSGAPVLKNFFCHVLNAYRDDERVKRISQFLESFFGSNLEDTSCELPKYDTVLSFIDLAIQDGMALDGNYQERELVELRNDMLYLLWLTLRTTTEGKVDPKHARFVRDVLKEDDSIVSLNYDLLIDSALQIVGEVR